MPRSFEISLEIEGLQDLSDELSKYKKRGVQAMAAGLYGLGLDIMRDSILDTPKDTGYLRASSYVTQPSTVVDPEVELGYGAEYAVYVHENITARHDEGHAKFLETAIQKHVKGGLATVRRRAMNVIDRGGGLPPSTVPTRPKKGKRPKSKKRRGRRR